MKVRALALLGVFVAAIGLAGCVTPSIPIPPPDPTRMMFDGVDGMDGSVTFSYPADSRYVDSTVFVFNQTQGLGVIASAHDDGSFGPTQAFSAIVGNQIIVSIQREDQTESTCVTLRDGGGAEPCF